MSVQTQRWRGTVRWAIAPYVPKAPFRLYAGAEQSPLQVGTQQLLEAGKRTGDVEQTYLVAGKVRPVLVVSDAPSEPHGELMALRLHRLSKMSADDAAVVRAQGDPLLFHLPPDRFDLPEENAAMVSTMFRLHADAIDDGPACGVLDENEWRVLGERLVRYHKFDLRLLFQQFVEAQRRR